MIAKIRYFLVILALPILLSGCLGTRHLKENEKLLVRQQIKAPPNVNEEELRALYSQRPNRRFLSLPGFHHLVTIYYLGKSHYDQEKFARKKAETEKKFDEKIARTASERKINNLQFRKQKKIDKYNSRIEKGNLFMQWGEPVAVYDSALVSITTNRFRNYLFSEGYFQNKVTPEVTARGKFVKVIYDVKVGPPYIIDSIQHRIADSVIYRLIRESERSSLIKKGERYQEDNFTQERERIDLYLKDNGYYDFSRQYIDFDIDTTLLGDRKIAVMMTIRDPARRGYHKQFVIDSIRVTTDAGVSMPGVDRSSRMYRGVKYMFYQDQYNLKILSQRVFLSPGGLYSRTKTLNTQRQLANLDAFKFVNINYDSTGGNFIANIFTSALDRYEWSNEIGVNVTEGYPGPFYNLNLKKRNLFGGLENFELNGRIGIEGVASATRELNVYKSTEAGVNASITFPQFIWPLRNATQIRLGKYNPKTKMTIGYNYTDRPEYKRTSTTFSNTYTWQNQRTTQYSLALTNVSLINSTIDTAFSRALKELGDKGNFNLARSFDPSFVSSMIFSLTWNRNYGTFDKNAVFIRAQFEPGGTILNFINPDIITRQGLQYFKYLRFNFDFRKVRVLNTWATFAYRINTGVAYSYGSDKSLPYEKYYFVGGSNSLRAWRPRRLGPGSVPPMMNTEIREGKPVGDPVSDGLFNYGLEKPGEILFEGSMELRSKLFGFVGGAIFVDAGNVWLFSQQRNLDAGEAKEIRGNSKFEIDSFYKELGIGTGFGLRFDFTFLVLRFDVGLKVYDPGRDPGDRFVLDKVKFFQPFATKTANGTYTNFREPVIYNVGIGYPF